MILHTTGCIVNSLRTGALVHTVRSNQFIAARSPLNLLSKFVTSFYCLLPEHWFQAVSNRIACHAFTFVDDSWGPLQ